MASKINIDTNSVKNHASDISNSASNIKLNSLSNIDTESTIAGNELSQKAYTDSQTMLSQLITSLENEATKIQSLGHEFSTVDTQLSNMVKSISSK